MKTKGTLLGALLLLQTLLFISCNDNDKNDTIRFYTITSVTGDGKEKLQEISGLNLHIGYTSGFYIKGGTGDYLVQTNMDEYVEVSADPEKKDYYRIKPHKLGSTFIRITDQKGYESELPLYIEKYSRTRTITDMRYIIEVEEGNIEGLEITYEEYITNVLEKRFQNIVTTSFKFYYSNPSEGELIVTNPEKETFEGTFEYGNIDGYASIKMEYDGEAHIYIRDLNYLKAIGPSYDYWLQDLTEEFREKYPYMKIERIVCCLYLLEENR